MGVAAMGSHREVLSFWLVDLIYSLLRQKQMSSSWDVLQELNWNSHNHARAKCLMIDSTRKRQGKDTFHQFTTSPAPTYYRSNKDPLKKTTKEWYRHLQKERRIEKTIYTRWHRWEIVCHFCYWPQLISWPHPVFNCRNYVTIKPNKQTKAIL